MKVVLGSWTLRRKENEHGIQADGLRFDGSRFDGKTLKHLHPDSGSCSSRRPVLKTPMPNDMAEAADQSFLGLRIHPNFRICGIQGSQRLERIYWELG